MSDNWICVIPRDPHFVPTQDAILRAERLLSEIAPDADSISSETADTVQFRDCGSNLETIRCQECAAEISPEWWADQMGDEDYWSDGFQLEPITLPCGHIAPSLNALYYNFDQGFSRFMLEAMNPQTGQLEARQVLNLEGALGCPVKVIYQHL